jgi:hypothetical protein
MQSLTHPSHARILEHSALPRLDAGISRSALAKWHIVTLPKPVSVGFFDLGEKPAPAHFG